MLPKLTRAMETFKPPELIILGNSLQGSSEKKWMGTSSAQRVLCDSKNLKII